MHTSTTSTVALVPWSAQQLEQATQGRWYLDRIPSHPIKRILTDSRHAEAGDAFLALKGERFDARNFVPQVAKQGCQVAIVSEPIENLDICQLIVADTRLALGHLGAYRRREYPQLKVIALTGSSGKTTVKEMLGSILSRCAPTLVTRGNLNNDLGVPMMLLELNADHQYAVMELGASHAGEIDYTAQMVQPHVAGILNIGTAHLGEFGGRDGICRAKSEIYAHIQANGTAIVPAADDYTAQITEAVVSKQRLSFGEGGDVYASDIELLAQSSRFVLHTPVGHRQLELPFAGLHNVHNAEAATAFALAIGVGLEQIIDGLVAAKNAQGRLNFIYKRNTLFIDDTYNANPSSMRAAAQVLTQQAGFKVMVMGDIGELGDASEQEHHDLGRDISTLALDAVIAVGAYAIQTAAGAASNSAQNNIHAFATQADALKYLIQLIDQHQHQQMSFLFKGSRFTHMETLMTDLMEKF
ncbi:UDP-N-acetylmuramoyl-tripeptide--D-alanyl-D-alanine ligase [Acinetobacter rudis]|uniref:UDP-N-acetylmuramoyl-tripeptide--D-alanyl-D- alanine ligase n=1 Tax=Acinetobacter rudis TaxID=632955 RepID=UPI00280FDD06|nr:UDP-N-acetylmuramoyl-tripeptide--D-alanyl-D-alanine ligase [Acinetobacter rudis]MDQ8953067.1 UDP-N-acetylmuramoyl-tripeptide--D-alanyl-D-alanine ligase [Acinetobacter rudis]